MEEGVLVRFQTPLEDIPEDTPSLLEQLCVFLSGYVEEKDVFGACVKDRVQLNQGKEDLETGRLVLSSGSQWPLAVGLLLLHLKFQTEPLISSDQYEQCCNVVLQTKGSSALCAAFNNIIENNLKPQRRRALREFLKYLWLVQNHKAVNGLDSIALATRFGNFIIRPPSGTEPILSRVKLMGALAILIESQTRSNLKSPGPLNSSLGGTNGGEQQRSPRSSESSVSIPTAIPSHVKPMTRPHQSLSIGMQTVDVARSAVIVIDSAQKTLAKFQNGLDEIQDKEKLTDLLKKLAYIEGLLASSHTSSSGAENDLVY